MNSPCTRSLLIAIIVTIGWGSASATPRDDLASPDPAVRKAAAAELLKTWKPDPSRSKWQPLLDKMPPGSSSVAAGKLLEQNHALSQGSAEGGGGATCGYRLDDMWFLILYVDTRKQVIMETKLEESIAGIWVEPPKNFTGKWITYYVNGHVSSELGYRNGERTGHDLEFKFDGTKLGH